MITEIDTILKTFDEKFASHESHCNFELEVEYGGPECSCNISEFKSFLFLQITELLQKIITELEEEIREVDEMEGEYTAKINQGFNTALNLAQERIRKLL